MLHARDIVQLRGAADGEFEGCLMIVAEVGPWGASGYVRVPAAGDLVDVYYRAEWNELVRVGQLPALAPPPPDGG